MDSGKLLGQSNPNNLPVLRAMEGSKVNRSKTTRLMSVEIGLVIVQRLVTLVRQVLERLARTRRVVVVNWKSAQGGHTRLAGNAVRQGYSKPAAPQKKTRAEARADLTASPQTVK